MKIGFSPAGLLFWAALYFFLSGEELLSILAAVAAHEAGHILALQLRGAKMEALLLTGTGLQIDYSRPLSPAEELFSALAGPLFGLLWFCAGMRLGFFLSAWLSLMLTAFNLVPLSAMDGGRALYASMRIASGERLAKRVSRAADAAVSVSMCAFGLWCAYRGFGVGAAIAAAWLTAYTVIGPCKTQQIGIK